MNWPSVVTIRLSGSCGSAIMMEYQSSSGDSLARDGTLHEVVFWLSVKWRRGVLRSCRFHLCGEGIFKAWGSIVRWLLACNTRCWRIGSPSAEHRFDEPARLSLGMVASGRARLRFTCKFIAAPPRIPDRSGGTSVTCSAHTIHLALIVASGPKVFVAIPWECCLLARAPINGLLKDPICKKSC